MNKNDTRLKLVVFVQLFSIDLFPLSHNCLDILYHEDPQRSKTSEVKKRTKKTRKWCHICPDLMIFFKTLFTNLL